ncbi:MAG: hypothetical protein HeimC3_32010 [Candidatus Heimdallarchaeota archaeon LC_3]|nr:MAG: hypothetical protein HeimC3_32010 [Candidatus Heimdallarchaeota archaeon LC_3]
MTKEEVAKKILNWKTNDSFGIHYNFYNKGYSTLLWDKGSLFSGSKFILINYEQINHEEVQLVFRAGIIAQLSLFLYNRMPLNLENGLVGLLLRRKTLTHFKSLLTYFEVDLNETPIKHIKKRGNTLKAIFGAIFDYLLVILFIFLPLGFGSILLIFGEFAFGIFLILMGSIFVIIYLRRLLNLKKPLIL